MKQPKPTNEQWATLYEEAAAFKQAAPWKGMYDRDLFGVQDPETGEVGYCCVLGRLGQVLGLNVYLGARGLGGYLGMQVAEFPEADPDIAYKQDTLVVHFDDRSFMEPEDLKRVKALGYSFKGKKAWPWIRRFEPGFYLRQINETEVVFLTRALQQTVEMAQRLKEDPGMLKKSGNKICLVRVPSIQEDWMTWEDVWQDLPVLKPPAIQVPPVDELRLKRLEKEVRRSGGIWEGDYFFSPAVIQEGGRPYHPQTVLWIQQESGQILAGEFFPHQGFEKAFQDHFMALIEKLEAIPQEIRVRKIEVLQLLQPVTDYLKISVALNEDLPGLEEARQAMAEFLRRK
jgi:hypothetical protein